MTTIVYDHKKGLIATDSRMCLGGRTIMTDNFNKAVRVGRRVWFFSGNVEDRVELTALSQGDKTGVSNDNAAFVVEDGAICEVMIIKKIVYSGQWVAVGNCSARPRQNGP